MARPRKLTGDSEKHAIDLAVEFGVDVDKARRLVVGFRPGMTALARQVLINDARRESNLPNMKKSMWDLNCKMDGERWGELRPFRPRGVHLVRKCVACENEPKLEARRSKKVGWEPVCWKHADELTREGRSEFRRLRTRRQVRLWQQEQRRYWKDPEKERARKREYYSLNRERIIANRRNGKKVAA